MAIEGERTETDSKQSRQKRKKQEFPYGNYRSYYGYRIGQNLEEDPRLKVFKKEWFEGKDCLDIGCNSGIVTVQIAIKFNCRSILGIDIDSEIDIILCLQDRVDDAFWHLRKASRLEAADIQGDLDLSANGVSKVDKQVLPNTCSSKKQDLRAIVSFKQQNFIFSRHPSEKHYDTILCLSVTKWIHLNWGDDGLIKLFYKIWSLLCPGGMLVLEPQPWKSYQSNYRVSETTANNFKTITLRPEKFQEILLDQIGFRTVEDLTPSLSGSNTGFNRPIFVFHK